MFERETQDSVQSQPRPTSGPMLQRAEEGAFGAGMDGKKVVKKLRNSVHSGWKKGGGKKV